MSHAGDHLLQEKYDLMAMAKPHYSSQGIHRRTLYK